MKVQCGQCPAKYAVSDERIREKKVRIHCKRCGAAIVVDGKVDPPLITSTPARPSVRAPAPPADPPPAPPERDPESQPLPRPVAHTILGGLEAPGAEQNSRPRSTPPPRPPRAGAPDAPTELPLAGMPSPHRGFTDPPPGGDDGRWRVALTKQDLRWMTTEEIAEAYRAGAVEPETFVFREGMPTWVTLLEMPEIAAALDGVQPGAAGSAAGPGAASPDPAKHPVGHTAPSPAPDRAEVVAPDPDAKGGAGGLDSLAATLRLGDEPEPIPFALVPERASGPSAPTGAAAKRGQAPEQPDPAPQEQPRQATPAMGPGAEARAAASSSPAASEPEAHPVVDAAAEPAAPAPFAAAQQVPSSSRWLWVAVVVLVLGAAAAFIGPRFGFRLP